MLITDPILVSGWGRNFSSLSKRASVTSIEQAQELLAQTDNGRGLLPVGLHRSYGDSALNSGGTLVDLSVLNGIVVDPLARTATVGAGTTIRELESAALAHSLFPPIVPGTGFVTMSAIASADSSGIFLIMTGTSLRLANFAARDLLSPAMISY